MLNELATEPGRPQEWLRAAWLRFHTVRPDDLPPGELRKLFIGIRNDLTSEEPTGNEGSVAATLRKMSNKQAVQLVGRIMAFIASSGTRSKRRGVSIPDNKRTP